MLINNHTDNIISGDMMSEFVIQKGYSCESKTFRLPENMVKMLEKLAAENHLSLNNLVVQCLEFAMQNVDGNNKNGNKFSSK